MEKISQTCTLVYSIARTTRACLRFGSDTLVTAWVHCALLIYGCLKRSQLRTSGVLARVNVAAT